MELWLELRLQDQIGVPVTLALDKVTWRGEQTALHKYWLYGHWHLRILVSPSQSWQGVVWSFPWSQGAWEQHSLMCCDFCGLDRRQSQVRDEEVIAWPTLPYTSSQKRFPSYSTWTVYNDPATNLSRSFQRYLSCHGIRDGQAFVRIENCGSF